MKNGAFEGTEMVTGERVEIGRDVDCGLVLDDDSVSRRHALLFEHDGKIAVQDLGSANGTRINGELVAAPRYVGPRDDLGIGDYTLKLKLMSGVRGASTVAPAPRAPVVAPSPEITKPRSAEPAMPAVDPAKPALGGDRLDVAHLGAPQASPQPAPVSMAAPRAAALPVTDVMPPTESGAHPPPPRAPTLDPRLLKSGASFTSASTVQSARPAAHAPPVDATIELAPLAAPSATVPPPAPVTDPSGPQSLRSEDVVPAGMPVVEWRPGQQVPDDDDEDDDLIPWSLVQRLVKPPPPEPKSTACVVEVIHYRGEVVVDHRTLGPGDAYRFGDRMTRTERRERGLGRPLKLVAVGGKRGQAASAPVVAELFVADGLTGRLLRQGQQIDLDKAPEAKAAGAVPLTDGDLASLKIGGDRVFVRFGKAPELVETPESRAELKADRRLATIAAATATLLWTTLAGATWLLQYRAAEQMVVQLEDEGFAEVALPELEMEKPEEKKLELEVKAPEPPKERAEKAPPSTKEKVVDAPEAPKEAPKQGVMDVLSQIPAVKDDASSQSLNAALSNVKGVRVPGASGFKTAALTGKAPSSGVQIGGAAGGLATSGINSIIRKDGAAGALTGKSSREVGGKVAALTRQSQVKGQGELSKEEIQRVINGHIGQIQYCYEKQLRTNPGLSGKVVLEWTVKTDGKVGSVKAASSTLASNEAVSCMMDKVKTWTFPKPRGSGSVVVVFPFIFNTL